MPAKLRGIEVLIKKASIDPAFKQLLLDKRADAAREIDLELEPSEIAMLNTVPRAQLQVIVARTVVPLSQRAAFLGKVAAVMLLAVGAAGMAALPAIARAREQARGIRPDRPRNRGTSALEEATRIHDSDASEKPERP